MKSQLNKYRQHTITDYLINKNKFKDYLLFCKEHDLKNEKKYLMDNILRTILLKENIEKKKLLSELQKLCAYIIIFSDFEIEILFQLSYLTFNPEFQKKIFNEVDEYLKNSENKINSETKIYISNKYYFWIMKLANQNFSSVNEIKDTILLEKEVKESVEKLIQYINEINLDIFETKPKNEQTFIIKIIYELSLYFYFKNEHKKSYKFSKSLVNYYDKYVQKYNIDINEQINKIFYFDIKDVKALIQYYEKENNKNDDNMVIDISMNNYIFNEDDINNCDNIILEDLSKYKSEFEQTKKNYNEKLQSTNLNLINEIDLKNKNCINSFSSCLKNGEYLCYKSSWDHAQSPIALNFVNSLQNKLDEKLKYNNSRKDENDISNIKIEIFFLLHFLDLVNKVNNKKEKLDKAFLSELSDFISNKKLTDNLRLSGLLHCYIINFGQNIKRTCSYFSRFVEFFADKTLNYKDETINQISFIHKITKIIYEVTEAKNKLSPPLLKESEVNFDDNLHISLIKIFLYWLSPKEDSFESDDPRKSFSNKKPKRKILKFSPSINILYIIIESLQNWEFLKIVKTIYSIVLKFLIDFKNLKNLEFNSDLLENIYQTKARIFKVDNLFENIVRGLKVKVDEYTYYVNINLCFKEKEKKEEYNIKEENINLYIKTLFNLIYLLDQKILNLQQKIQTREDIEKNLNELNYSKKNKFLFSYFYLKEVNLLKNTNKEIKLALNNGIDYLNNVVENYKINYLKLDLMCDNIKLRKNYEAFKLLIDQDVLYQIIICFIKEKKYLESIILIQYSVKFDKILALKLIKNMLEKNEFINLDNLKYIWKINIFEHFANYYYKMGNLEAVNKITALIKRISNHQYFKGHPIRKNFKILNFFNFLDFLNNTNYNI